MIKRIFIIAIAMFALASCQESEVKSTPQAVAMTEEALGHYCQMNLIEHEGPMAQIHLTRLQHPIWFSQVRDAVAFTKLPEETEEIAAIYVSDMGKAPSWARPGNDNWIDATEAWFVIGSKIRGGMGAPEVVPFADKAAAAQFAETNGGDIVRLADIPDAYVLAPVEVVTDQGDTHTRDTDEPGGNATQ